MFCSENKQTFDGANDTTNDNGKLSDDKYKEKRDYLPLRFNHQPAQTYHAHDGECGHVEHNGKINKFDIGRQGKEMHPEIAAHARRQYVAKNEETKSLNSRKIND